MPAENIRHEVRWMHFGSPKVHRFTARPRDKEIPAGSNEHSRLEFHDHVIPVVGERTDDAKGLGIEGKQGSNPFFVLTAG